MITPGCSIPLSNKHKRFQEKLALVRRVDEDPFGGTSGVPGGQHSTYAIIYRKMKTVSPVRYVWSSFKFRHRP